jgi:hypothetical protein
MMKKYGDASQALEQLLTNFPKTSYKTRVQFWLGKAYAKDSHQAEAKKVFGSIQSEYPLTYYGLMSAQETGVPIESALEAHLTACNSR